MAITDIIQETELTVGAPDITYSGNEGPKSPQEIQRMKMAQLEEEYNKYVFEMEEQGMEPVSIREFIEQAMAEGQMSSNQEGMMDEGLGSMVQEPRTMAAYGGIMGGDGRRAYVGGSYRDSGNSGYQGNSGAPGSSTTSSNKTSSNTTSNSGGGGGGRDSGDAVAAQRAVEARARAAAAQQAAAAEATRVREAYRGEQSRKAEEAKKRKDEEAARVQEAYRGQQSRKLEEERKLKEENELKKALEEEEEKKANELEIKKLEKLKLEEDKKLEEENKKIQIQIQKSVDNQVKKKKKNLKNIVTSKDLELFDNNEDGKLGLIERFNRFTNKINKEAANKRAFQKYQNVEQYVDPFDNSRYGLSGKEMSEKRGFTFEGDEITGYDRDNATDYGYNIIGNEDLDKGLATLKTSTGTRPNLYDVNSNLPGTYGALLNPLFNKFRPDTQVTAMNTLNKAADYSILGGQDRVSNDDLRDLGNLGRTEDQIKLMEKGSLGGDDSQQQFIPFNKTNQEEEVEVEEEPFQLGLAFRADGGRVGKAYGGMMGDDGRRAYGLGSIFKKATKAFKKIAKSPIGKAALIGLGGNAIFGGGLGGTSFMQGLKSKGLPGILKQAGSYALDNPGIIIPALSAGAAYFTDDEEQDTYVDKTGIDVDKIRANPYKYLARANKADGGPMGERIGYNQAGPVIDKDTQTMILDMSNRGMDIETISTITQQDAATINAILSAQNQKAQGGPMGGEIMEEESEELLNMNGMEKDYREEGGFVPIGEYEKKDDVPARLSKNEFVFTADAVRGAGEGDVDLGAEKLYTQMKDLESVGKRMQGANEMFQTSQRLEEVI